MHKKTDKITRMEKRTAREINVDSSLIDNKNINVKIGTVENKDNPNTVYITISFWIDNIQNEVETNNRKKIEQQLNIITSKNFIQQHIIDENIFAYEKDNIYLINIPKNLHYNNKPSFIIIEFYLNTINIRNRDNKLPLSQKKDLRLFKKSVKIANAIGEVIKNLEEIGFLIKKTQKK